MPIRQCFIAVQQKQNTNSANDRFCPQYLKQHGLYVSTFFAAKNPFVCCTKDDECCLFLEFFQNSTSKRETKKQICLKHKYIIFSKLVAICTELETLYCT